MRHMPRIQCQENKLHNKCSLKTMKYMECTELNIFILSLINH